MCSLWMQVLHVHSETRVVLRGGMCSYPRQATEEDMVIDLDSRASELAQLRSNAEERDIRAKVRDAQREFAPGRSGAVAVARARRRPRMRRSIAVAVAVAVARARGRPKMCR